MSDRTAPGDRRHDLDALRAFAMLLGIALHAALAYSGAGWVVSDDRVSVGLGMLVPAIHGFRMPLFFLISGFFTAMLWRRRGLEHLLSQRARRILLPLTLGCLTIVPAMWGVTRWAVSQQTVQVREAAGERAPRERAPTPGIWTVAAYGDMEGLRAYTADSELLNTPDPTFGVTPLGWTVIRNTPNATEYLLEVGADPSARYQDRNTPLHTACFFGRSEVAELLLRAGADQTAASATGDPPVHAMSHDRHTVELIANILKVPIDYDEVTAGRDRIRRMLEGADVARSKATPRSHAGESWPAWLRSQLRSDVFFQHLWFLWFLCWLNAGFALVVLLARVLPSVKLPAALVGPPRCLLWLVPLTLLTQSRMHVDGAVPGFGPDTSAGLAPAPHVLLHYAAFFGFGAVTHCARGPSARLGRFWYAMLPIALVVLPFGLMFGYNAAGAADIIAHAGARRWVSCLLQVLYPWLMTLGLLGLSESMLAKDRPWLRYLSDASYWLYLVHLPLIIVGQALLLRTDLPPLAEFALLTTSTTAALLVTYHVAVRYTPIGALLNGKRARPPEGSISTPNREGERTRPNIS
ncbi:MAG TPA: acyltransferase family protein [Phycisphaerales bacterium]|nr:acyltransferase family protein [Phycisphaerales bacterium]